MSGRIILEVKEDTSAVVYIRSIEPYEAVKVLIMTALALLDGTAHVEFNDGPFLTEEEVEDKLTSGNTGGQRDN